MVTKSIYSASTPYHVILACGIAKYLDKSDEKYLIVSPHYDEESLSWLINWKGNPFKNGTMLSKAKSGIFAKIKNIDTNYKIIKTFFGFPTTAYIFNIEQPEGQYVAFLNKDGENIYVEDGVGAYLNKISGDFFPIRLLKKLMYGYWFDRCDNQMKCKLIHSVMAFKPELIDTDMEKTSIPLGIYGMLKQDGLFDAMSQHYGIGDIDCDILFLFPFSKQAEAMEYSTCVDAYRQLLEKFKDKKILIKYHPREDEGRYITEENFKEIPRNISAELAYMNWKSEKKVVISDTSTGLYTLKLIHPDARAISIMDILNYNDPDGVKPVYKAFNVELPKKVEDVNI